MKHKTIRARNILDAERLREYVRFFFRLNYGFLGAFSKSMAFMLLLISLAALYTKEWLVFVYIIITAIILGGFSVFVKSVMFSRIKKNLGPHYLNECTYTFNDDKLIIEVLDEAVEIPYESFTRAYESNHSLYISCKIKDEDSKKSLRRTILIGKNNMIGDSDFLDLRYLVLNLLGKKYKDKHKIK